MKTTLLGALNVGDKFKLFSDGCVWEVLDKNPKEYGYVWRVGSGRFTTTMSPAIIVIVV